MYNSLLFLLFPYNFPSAALLYEYFLFSRLILLNISLLCRNLVYALFSVQLFMFLFFDANFLLLPLHTVRIFLSFYLCVIRVLAILTLVGVVFLIFLLIVSVPALHKNFIIRFLHGLF